MSSSPRWCCPLLWRLCLALQRYVDESFMDEPRDVNSTRTHTYTNETRTPPWTTMSCTPTLCEWVIHEPRGVNTERIHIYERVTNSSFDDSGFYLDNMCRDSIEWNKRYLEWNERYLVSLYTSGIYTQHLFAPYICILNHCIQTIYAVTR